MTNLTINDLLTRYRYLLYDRTYVNVFDFYLGHNLDPKNLQNILFGEESASHDDTSWDTSDSMWSRNPMNQKYIDKVNAKRITLGVSQLTKNSINRVMVRFTCCRTQNIFCRK